MDEIEDFKKKVKKIKGLKYNKIKKEVNKIKERMEEIEFYNESNVAIMGAQNDCMYKFDKDINKLKGFHDLPVYTPITYEDDEKMVENIDINLKELMDKVDVTKDGKFDKEDIKIIAVTAGYLFFIIMTAIVTSNKERLINMFITGNIDYEFIMTTILLGTVSGVFSVMKNKFNKESTTDKKKIKELTSHNSSLEKEKAQMELDHKLDMKKVIHEKEIELMKKELEIVEIRTNTNIEKASKDKIVREGIKEET